MIPGMGLVGKRLDLEPQDLLAHTDVHPSINHPHLHDRPYLVIAQV